MHSDQALTRVASGLLCPSFASLRMQHNPFTLKRQTTETRTVLVPRRWEVHGGWSFQMSCLQSLWFTWNRGQTAHLLHVAGRGSMNKLYLRLGESTQAKPNPTTSVCWKPWPSWVHIWLKFQNWNICLLSTPPSTQVVVVVSFLPQVRCYIYSC